MSGWSLTTVRDLTQVDLGRWAALFGSRAFYSAGPWLRHAQATAAIEPYYLVLHREDRWEAALPAYPLEPATPYVFCSPGNVIDNLHRQVCGEPAPWAAALMPALACGGRNPSHTKVGALSREARHEVVRAAEEQAWADGLRSVSFLYVDEDDAELREVLEGRDYVPIPGQTAYSLTVPPAGGFDGYLAQLGSRRRGKIKRELRDLTQSGLSYRIQPLTLELAEAIAPLELALYARHGTPADAAAFRKVLDSIAVNLADCTRIATAELNGELVGFLLFFTYAGEYYARQAGFDYDKIGKLPVYFGLVYYEMIKVAQDEAVSGIHYSTGSDQAKRHRGATPRRQFAYLKTMDAELRRHLLRLKDQANSR